MKILSLNCQHGYQPGLKDFFHRILNAETYDFLLLQEVEETVLLFLQHPSYGIIRSFNEETGEDSQLCIVYKKSYDLTRTKFKSFSSMRKDPVFGLKHPCMGLLWADFKLGDGRSLRAASMHLHSGTNARVRLAELEIAKKLLLIEEPTSTLLAGDFNAGFPYERSNMARMLSPEFKWATKDLGHTLSSRYTEHYPHLPNRIAAFLSIFNIEIHLHTDHIFVDNKTGSNMTTQPSILPDRVSDHSPVEFTIKLPR